MFLAARPTYLELKGNNHKTNGSQMTPQCTSHVTDEMDEERSTHIVRYNRISTVVLVCVYFYSYQM